MTAGHLGVEPVEIEMPDGRVLRVVDAIETTTGDESELCAGMDVTADQFDDAMRDAERVGYVVRLPPMPDGRRWTLLTLPVDELDDATGGAR